VDHANQKNQMNKAEIHAAFENVLHEKISLLQNNLAELKESGANQTKSTAGDKHETALAMLQIEQANNRVQLENLQQQVAIFHSIQTQLVSTKVLLGSLVQTSTANFYVSTAVGKIIWQEDIIYAISTASPIALAMLGKSSGEEFECNQKKYTIHQIL
jgi:transcription elongation GreA/GreB family factor